MNKLKQILYEFKLKRTEDNLKSNSEKIESAVKNNVHYNIYSIEQLRLMSNRSYLKNKLNSIPN